MRSLWWMPHQTHTQPPLQTPCKYASRAIPAPVRKNLGESNGYSTYYRNINREHTRPSNQQLKHELALHQPPTADLGSQEPHGSKRKFLTCVAEKGWAEAHGIFSIGTVQQEGRVVWLLILAATRRMEYTESHAVTRIRSDATRA